MASEMKPCPFCGWEGASVVTDCGTSFVRCQDCEARTGSTDTGPIAAIARWNARPAPEYAGLVERLGDAELQRLLKDLAPYREKTIGSLRIDMGEVRKICRAVEVCDEATTALTALTERNKALEAEVEAKWLPIETAPTDGTEVLVWIRPKVIRLGWYFKRSSRTQGWCDENGQAIEPKAWMHMFSPPELGA